MQQYAEVEAGSGSTKIVEADAGSETVIWKRKH